MSAPLDKSILVRDLMAGMDQVCSKRRSLFDIYVICSLACESNVMLSRQQLTDILTVFDEKQLFMMQSFLNSGKKWL